MSDDTPCGGKGHLWPGRTCKDCDDGGDEIPRWSHPELADDLAANFHRPGLLMAREVSVAPWGATRADVASMCLSWRRPLLTIYEVKASRADFVRELRSEKWRKSMEFSERFYFAVPEGIITLDEVPKGVGRLVRTAVRPDRAVWLLEKRASRRTLPVNVRGQIVFAFLLASLKGRLLPEGRER